MNANSPRSFEKSSTRLALTAAALALIMGFALVVLVTPAAQAQTYKVLHNFTNGGDGAYPVGLTIDGSGSLYGTTTDGGVGYGTVFKLSRFGPGWIFNTLYSFGGGTDAANPSSRPLLAPDGTLYGTTHAGGGGGHCGGGGGGCGTVYHLQPPSTAPKTALTSWNERVIYSFNSNGRDDPIPIGDLIFDQAGNLYGTTAKGGAYSAGTVYKFDFGYWSETDLYTFQGLGDGYAVNGGVIFDSFGNLYGTAAGGGQGGSGTVYRLSPSGSGWKETTLHSFTGGNDGGGTTGGLIIDSSGDLYGTTESGGSGGGGTVFELTPGDGGWTFSTLYSFSGQGPWPGPYAKPAMDAAGNLYGTTNADGAYGWGNVFKLTPSPSGWAYTSLHDFTGGNDGGSPQSSIVFDANGNLYGTTNHGGTGDCYGRGCGVVFEITP